MANDVEHLFICLFDISIFSSVQSVSCVWLFATPWTAVHQASLSITNCRSPPKPMSIVSVMPSNHLILCRPLPLLPSIFPSIRVFPNESALRIRWPKYRFFSFNISPSDEHPGLISFRMDWLDLLVVQGTLKSLFTASDLTSVTSHIHNWVLFLLWLHPFVISVVISPLISSSILGTYWPGEFLFEYPVILPFHTVHGVLKARILKWFAIPFSSGPHSVRPLNHDPPVLGCPVGMAWFHWVRQGTLGHCGICVSAS